MSIITRRKFLKVSATIAALGHLSDLSFLAPLSHASANHPVIAPDEVRLDPDIAALIRLIRITPRDECVPVFVRRLRAGLSYRDFLAALFLASFESNDLHHVLQIYSAHRIGSEARAEERLLPLFWALDRIKQGYEEGPAEPPRAMPEGALPSAERATAVFRDAMTRSDPNQAEQAIVALARSLGARRAMAQLWEYGARNVSGTLGHHPITVANAWRTLHALEWQNAEPVLRYIARYFSGFQGDRTYTANVERVKKTLPALAAGWASDEPCRAATLEVYGLLRAGDADATCDLVCAQLSSGEVKAGALWDAVHLVAADLLFRYRTGGSLIGSVLIHAVTTTNALRFGFDHSSGGRVRLLMLLQGIGALGDVFIGPAQKEGQLRQMNLLDLEADTSERRLKVADVFSILPYKSNGYVESDPSERKASDRACRLLYSLLRDPKNYHLFRQAARSFLCIKASSDPHDIKYPAAAFEDALRIERRWRPYLLAASVHALHGTKSRDTRVLAAAREGLR